MGIVQFDLSTAPRIGLEEAKKLFDEGAAVFVDVRSRADFEKAHMPGAVDMPLRDVPLQAKRLSRDKVIITY